MWSLSTGLAWLSFRPVRDSLYSGLWKLVSSVTQSASDFAIDKVFTVTVHCVEVPTGGGKAKPITHDGVAKKSTVQINNLDGLCLPRALVIANADAARGTVQSGTLHESYNSIRHAGSRLQLQAAQGLVTRASVVIPETGCGVYEIGQF